MSLHGFGVAMSLHRADHSFYALIMAAMAKADNENLSKLQAAWPDVWDEVSARYNAPGGLMPSEVAERERAEKEA